MAGLRLENVTKRFGKITALNGVTLDIHDGEFFAVLGPPGAGKTTLLRTIVGLETPEEGDVYADGDPSTTLPATVRLGPGALRVIAPPA